MDMQQMVAEFHTRLAFPRNQPFVPLLHPRLRKLFSAVSATMTQYASELQDAAVDPKLDASDRTWALRFHLMTEELDEAFAAVLDGDETSLLDALTDLLYVVFGTGDVLDLPLGEAFVAVHASNMTKSRQKSDKFADRVRDKGPDYVPADLRELLKSYRASRRAADAHGRQAVTAVFSIERTEERTVAVKAENYTVYMSRTEHDAWVRDGRRPITLSREQRLKLNLHQQEQARTGGRV